MANQSSPKRRPIRRSAKSLRSTSPLLTQVEKPRVDGAPELSEGQSDEVAKAFSEATGPLIVGGLWGRPEVPTPANYKEYSDEYQQLAWVYAAVFAIATGGAIVPWDIWDGPPDEELGGKKLEHDHPAVRLFEFPNEEETWFDLLEAVLSYLELGGDSYLEIARNTLDKPGKLFALRPDRTKIVARKDGKGIEYYRFKVTPHSKNKLDFVPDDIMHFRYFHPYNDWYGLSALSAAAQSVVSEHYTIRYNQNFFKHDATPGGYLATDSKINRTQADEIGRKWREGMGGVDKSHRVAVLPGGLRFHVVGISPRDMQFLLQRRYNREEILAVFGVPPVKVGLLDNIKYNNYQLQEAAFYRDTLQPKLRKIQGVFTRFLRREFGPNLTFWFDLSEFLIEDRNRQAERFVKLFGIGAISPNEIIREVGLTDTYEGGDVHYVSAAYVPVGEESVVAGERQTAAIVEEMKREMGSNFERLEEFTELLEGRFPTMLEVGDRDGGEGTIAVEDGEGER